MILRKSAKDIERIARAGDILARAHDELRASIVPGVSTRELDQLAERFIRAEGGSPTFLGYRGFRGSICASRNDMIVHGIPSPDEVLESGDLFSIDLGVTYNGWIADAARSYVVGNVPPTGTGRSNGGAPKGSAQHLIDTAWESLDAAIALCEPGNMLGDVSHAVQQVVEGQGYSVVKALVGHGVGRSLHEDPQVPNHGPAGAPPILEEGWVLAIEPMITLGGDDIREGRDGWAIYTTDGSLAAHVEHTVAVTADGPKVLTVPSGA